MLKCRNYNKRLARRVLINFNCRVDVQAEPPREAGIDPPLRLVVFPTATPRRVQRVLCVVPRRDTGEPSARDRNRSIPTIDLPFEALCPTHIISGQQHGRPINPELEPGSLDRNIGTGGIRHRGKCHNVTTRPACNCDFDCLLRRVSNIKCEQCGTESIASSAIRPGDKIELLLVPVCEEKKWKWPDSDPFRPRSRKVGLLSKCKAQKATEGHTFLVDQLRQQLQPLVSSPPVRNYTRKSPTQNSTWQPITLLFSVVTTVVPR